ncbi:MAG TPA: glycoside hydrolase family protein [Candidatus Sulfotelmatobacter sp.]|jgi:lysozyme
MAINCLEDQLRRDESERQFAYDDATGRTLGKGDRLQANLTIGVGRNLSAKGLSQKERAYLLANDIADATADLAAHLPWALELDDARKGAMLNLVFNMGIRGVMGFPKFLAAMQAGDWATAKAELLDSEAARQEPDRIDRLALQIETGFWQ